MKTRLMAVLCVCGVLTPGVLGQTSRPQDSDRQPASKSVGKKVNLRPRFKVGQEVRFTMDMKANRKNTGSAPGAPGSDPDAGMAMMGDGKQDMEMTVVFRCTDADPEEGYTLNMTFEKFKMEANVGGQPMKIDSSKPNPDDPLAEAFGSIVGTSMPVQMDKDGNISSIGGGLGGGLGGAMSGMMGGGDIFKNFFGPMSTQSKSPGEASVGESWTNEDAIEGGLGTFRMKTTNTLKSHSGGIATIQTKGAYSLDPSSSKAGVKIREGDMSGETRFNTEVGMIDSMNMRQKLKIEKKDAKSGAMSSSDDEMTLKVTRVKSGK